MANNQGKSRKRLVLKVMGVLPVIIAGWVMFDLYGPRTAHLREFDPDEVAAT